MKPDSTLDPTIHTFLPSGVAKLEHLGIIRVTGADAASFLQGQLTNDVVLLGMNESRLADVINGHMPAEVDRQIAGLKHQRLTRIGTTISSGKITRTSSGTPQAKAGSTLILKWYMLCIAW